MVFTTDGKKVYQYATTGAPGHIIRAVYGWRFYMVAVPYGDVECNKINQYLNYVKIWLRMILFNEDFGGTLFDMENSLT